MSPSRPQPLPAARPRIEAGYRKLRWLTAVAVAACLAAPAFAAPGAGIDDYERLRRWRFSAPLPVPAQGIGWSRDTAEWRLESGQVRLQEPTAAGRVTGLVFSGRGRFRMSVPDPVERRHLGRITEQPGLEALDVAFTEMVLRTSEEVLHGWLDVAATSGYQENALAAKRHGQWLEKRLYDADARVLAGLNTPGDAYLRIDMKTEPFGWLTFEFDAQRREEVQLQKYQGMNEFVETWISLDRPEHRDGRGRPSGERHGVIDVRHVRLEADISDRTHKGGFGLSDTSAVKAYFRAALSFVPRTGGATALALELRPGALLGAVSAEGGRELAFVRDHVGARSGVDKRVYDSSLVVLLDKPLVAGEERRLYFEYGIEILNYLSGRSWYPNLEDNFFDPHTAELWITGRKKTEVRAIGELREKIEGDGGNVTWVWEMKQPTKMVSFSFSDRFNEAVLEVEGAPKVISFGPPVSSRAKAMVKNVGADVVNSLRFYQWLFDSRLPVDTMQVTGITSGHGQAFEGFLHMSEYTFFREVAGPSELFRAHEVAHQWWGHEVGWESYRDQWLSEAFAEYSAMMFIETTMKNGHEYFEDILRAYTEMLLGKMTGWNRFARPSLNDLDLSHRRRVGPIGLGIRAGTSEMPAGYVLQAYHKGPLVLHMLRHAVRGAGGDDNTFVQILRDFVHTHRGTAASTDDFQAIVARHAPGDWSWFFDQWIYDNVIPKYRWSHTVTPAGDGSGGSVLSITVEQEGVPPGFKMPVPVRIEMPGSKGGTVKLNVTKPRETFTFNLPQKPKKVLFNPDFAVLARVDGKG